MMRLRSWSRAALFVSLPLKHFVAAISVGVYQGMPVLDLDYQEDSGCDTDMNVVMTDAGHFIEVQGTAEGAAFDRDTMDRCSIWRSRGSPT